MYRYYKGNMRYISLRQFLKLFEGDNPRTFSQFIHNSSVLTKQSEKVPLKTYMKENNISKEDMKLIYDHILHRMEYLTRFYET